MSKRERKKAERSRQFRPPEGVVTIAHYGPDDRTISKVVAGFVRRPGAESSKLRRWVGTGITESPEFGRELLDFIKSHRPKNIVLVPAVIGCIHESGKDYPEGQDCPFCPFWTGKDRWANATPVVYAAADLSKYEAWLRRQAGPEAEGSHEPT